MVFTQPVILQLDQVNLTDEQFYQLCQANQDMQLERSAAGALIIRPPVGGASGEREADLISLLWVWNRERKAGKVFSSQTTAGGRSLTRCRLGRTITLECVDSPRAEGFPPFALIL